MDELTLMKKVLETVSNTIRYYEDGLIDVEETYNKIAWEVLTVMKEQGIKVE